MIPTLARVWMLAVGRRARRSACVAFAIATRRRGALRASRRRRLGRRQRPARLQGLVVAGVARETYLRFHHPPSPALRRGASGLFVGLRLSRLSAAHGPRPADGARRPLGASRPWRRPSSSPSRSSASRSTASPIVVALDRSRSVDLVPGAEARVRSELQVAEKSMHDDDRIGTIVFGAERRRRGSAAAEERGGAPAAGRGRTRRDGPRGRHPPRPRRAPCGRRGPRRARDRRRADARRRARGGGGGGRRRRRRSTSSSSTRKCVPDVRVVSVRAPPRADEGEPFELRVVTSSPVATDVELRVRRDDGDVRVVRTHIETGEDVLRLRETVERSGPAPLRRGAHRARPERRSAPDDNVGQRVRARARRGPSRSSSRATPGHGAPLRKALEASGFRTVERSTTGVPADVGGLAPYDLVVLSDVRASDLAHDADRRDGRVHARPRRRPAADGRRPLDGPGRLRAHPDRGGVAASPSI